MTGPFYIETDCCLTCGVPESIAPELFGMGESACFIRRQPESQPDIDKMVAAMRSSEADCIRYRGNDIGFLKRLGEAGMAPQADDERALDFTALRRDRVSFLLPAGRPQPISSSSLAGLFRDFVGQKDRYTVLPPVLRRNRVLFSWYELHFHSVVFQAKLSGRAIAILRPDSQGALQGLAGIVDEWLRGTFGATGIAWHTKEGLAAGEDGYRLPY